MMQKIKLHKEFIEKTLVELLNINSPSGYSDQIVHFVGNKLENEMTSLKGFPHQPARGPIQIET